MRRNLWRNIKYTEPIWQCLFIALCIMMAVLCFFIYDGPLYVWFSQVSLPGYDVTTTAAPPEITILGSQRCFFIAGIALSIAIILYIGLMLKDIFRRDRLHRKSTVKIPSQRSQWGMKAYGMRFMLIAIYFYIWWRIVLLCSDVVVHIHRAQAGFNTYGFKMWSAGIAFTPSYTLVFDWCMWSIPLALLIIPVAIRLNFLAKLDRNVTLSRGSLKANDDISFTSLGKWFLVFLFFGLALWVFSPEFLGEGSENFQTLWSWGSGFGFWVCVGIMLTTIIAWALCKDSAQKMRLFCVTLWLLTVLSIAQFFDTYKTGRHFPAPVGLGAGGVLLLLLFVGGVLRSEKLWFISVADNDHETAKCSKRFIHR